MKIVVGIDGSEHSIAALKFACRLLNPHTDSVVLYYSVPTGTLEALRPQATEDYARAREAFAQSIFQKAKDALSPALLARCVTVHDNQKPHKGLLATAAAQDADLLVVGARGTGPVARLLLGSVSHAVARACELPTLIVRNPPATDPASPLHVLIAVADADSGQAICEILQKVSWPAGSDARLMHVIESLFAGEVPDWVVQHARSSEVELQAQAWILEHEHDKERAAQQLRELCPALPAGIAHKDVIVAEGNPPQQILEHLDREEFDLAILGTQGQGRVMRMLLGSTSEHVLSHAPGSVLIVPHHAA